jgi:hypothetical protein
MLARSLNKLEHQDFGYQVQERVLVSLNRPPATYTPGKLAALYRQIEERLNRLPGVQGSGLALYNPLTDNWSELIFVSGHPAPKMSEESGASWDRVSARYLQHLGVPVLRGRAFTRLTTKPPRRWLSSTKPSSNASSRATRIPLDQHFGLDLPELAGTFRIVGRHPRREVRRLGLEPAGATDVLRAAGAIHRL